MADNDKEVTQSTGEDVHGQAGAALRDNAKKLAGAESDAVGTAKRLHEQGKAAAAKHGG